MTKKTGRRGGNHTSAPAVLLPVAVDNARISISLAGALYREHDVVEDRGIRFVGQLATALLRGNRWALAHAPVLLPAALALIATADDACDAALGTHLPGALEALTDVERQFEALLGASGAAGLDALEEALNEDAASVGALAA